MAALTHRNATLVDSQGRQCTVDLNYDSITFVVASVVVTNPWDVSYTYTVTNTAIPAVTFTRVVAAGATDTFVVLISWTLNADLSQPSNWIFQG